MSDIDTSLQTIIITGISPHSPLSTHIASHILAHSKSQNLSIALIGPSFSHLLEAAATLRTHALATIPSIKAFEVDITSAQSIGVAAHEIRATFGAADLVIHNASAHLPGAYGAARTSTSIRGADEDDWWEIFEVNVRSIQSVARHFFTKMRGGGVFVNVFGGSETGWEKGMSAWDASGAAAERVVKYLAAENRQFRCLGMRLRQDGGLSDKEWEREVEKVVELFEI